MSYDLIGQWCKIFCHDLFRTSYIDYQPVPVVPNPRASEICECTPTLLYIKAAVSIYMDVMNYVSYFSKYMALYFLSRLENSEIYCERTWGIAMARVQVFVFAAASSF